MDITFRQSDYTLNFSEKQLKIIFNYFNNCVLKEKNKKRYYEGIVIGFLKTENLEIIPDIWCSENTKKEDTCIISDKMMEIIKRKEQEKFKIYHFHSHPSSLPFPSPDDPYNWFESIGIVSMKNPEFNEFRIFNSLEYSSYPPSLGNIKCDDKKSTLVRFGKKDKKISFLPLEKEVMITNIPEIQFMRDW